MWLLGLSGFVGLGGVDFDVTQPRVQNLTLRLTHYLAFALDSNLKSLVLLICKMRMQMKRPTSQGCVRIKWE